MKVPGGFLGFLCDRSVVRLGGHEGALLAHDQKTVTLGETLSTLRIHGKPMQVAHVCTYASLAEQKKLTLKFHIKAP